MPQPSDDDDDMSDENTKVDVKMVAITPNNTFTRTLSSPLLFYLFIAVLLVIVVWWVTFMMQYGNDSS